MAIRPSILLTFALLPLAGPVTYSVLEMAEYLKTGTRWAIALRPLVPGVAGLNRWASKPEPESGHMMGGSVSTGSGKSGAV